ADAKAKVDADAKAKGEADAKAKAEADAKAKAEADALKAKTEAEAEAETEARAKADADAKLKAEREAKEQADKEEKEKADKEKADEAKQQDVQGKEVGNKDAAGGVTDAKNAHVTPDAPPVPPKSMQATATLVTSLPDKPLPPPGGVIESKSTSPSKVSGTPTPTSSVPRTSVWGSSQKPSAWGKPAPSSQSTSNKQSPASTGVNVAAKTSSVPRTSAWGKPTPSSQSTSNKESPASTTANVSAKTNEAVRPSPFSRVKGLSDPQPRLQPEPSLNNSAARGAGAPPATTGNAVNVAPPTVAVAQTTPPAKAAESVSPPLPDADSKTSTTDSSSQKDQVSATNSASSAEPSVIAASIVSPSTASAGSTGALASKGELADTQDIKSADPAASSNPTSNTPGSVATGEDSKAVPSKSSEPVDDKNDATAKKDAVADSRSPTAAISDVDKAKKASADITSVEKNEPRKDGDKTPLPESSEAKAALDPAKAQEAQSPPDPTTNTTANDASSTSPKAADPQNVKANEGTGGETMQETPASGSSADTGDKAGDGGAVTQIEGSTEDDAQVDSPIKPDAQSTPGSDAGTSRTSTPGVGVSKLNTDVENASDAGATTPLSRSQQKKMRRQRERAMLEKKGEVENFWPTDGDMTMDTDAWGLHAPDDPYDDDNKLPSADSDDYDRKLSVWT
ncbi:hypothetical protein EW146_g10450, partial [Bondarzewia mesenterica]